MTPRTRIAWLDAKAPLDDNLRVMRDTPYSRYPVYRGGEHEVLGVLEVKRLVGQLGSSNQADLFRALRKPLYVPATARALDLLEEFRDAETRARARRRRIRRHRRPGHAERPPRGRRRQDSQRH